MNKEVVPSIIVGTGPRTKSSQNFKNWNGQRRPKLVECFIWPCLRRREKYWITSNYVLKESFFNDLGFKKSFARFLNRSKVKGKNCYTYNTLLSLPRGPGKKFARFWASQTIPFNTWNVKISFWAQFQSPMEKLLSSSFSLRTEQ